MKFLIVSLSLVCLWAVPSLARDIPAGENADEVGKQAPLLDDKDVGFDLHRDYFYFEDKLVEDAFKRRNYVNARLTLAGQQPDMTGRQVKEAHNPFVIAQKTMHTLGVSSGRWDVKEDFYGNQYVALYHGDKHDFVVNKLRGHLLRRLVNAVQEQLPILDSQTVASEDEKDTNNPLATVREEVTHLISKVVMDIDENIRSAMRENDASSATITAAIITKTSVITINVGNGKVLAYNDIGMINDLTRRPEEFMMSPSDDCKSIGDFKGRAGLCVAKVNIIPRVSKIGPLDDQDDDEDEDGLKTMQFLVLESPFVAKLIEDETVAKTVVSQINQHKFEPSHEQEMYSNSVLTIIQQATEQFNPLDRVLMADHSVALVGLERDYKLIH